MAATTLDKIGEYDVNSLFSRFIEILKEFADAIINEYKKQLTDDDRVATGNLLRSISPTIKADESFNFEIWLNLEDYYYYIENGRNGGKFPPIDKIKEWIEAKPVLPRPDKNGKLPTTNQLAFLISRKIAKEGYKGKPSLMTALDRIDKEYLPKLQQAFEEDLDRYLGFVMGHITDRFNFLK